MNADEAMHWLLQGALRQQLLLCMNQPLTIGQLSKKLGVALELCSRSIHQMAVYRLVSCMTPLRRHCRLYWLTDLGADCQKELQERHSLPAIKHMLPELEYSLYASVCSRYRKALLRHLIFPMRAVEVRKRAVGEDPSLRMSPANARDTLRCLVRMQVMEREFSFDRTYVRYRLNATGRQLQRLLKNAEAKPCLGLWKI